MKSLAADPAVRRSGIGGSDAAAAVGVSRYKTKLLLYMEKVGEVIPEDLSDNEAVQWGLLLEDTVAKEAARRNGWKVRKNNATLRHKEHPFVMAHLDREIVGERWGLEVKTAGQYMANEWGEEGSDDIPMEHMIQVAHYMAVTGKDGFYLSVLIGGRDLRTYKITRDDKFVDNLIKIETDFWYNHVVPKVPPEPTELSDMRLLYPEDDGTTSIATLPIEAMHEELMLTKHNIKGLKEREEELKFQLQNFMAEATELLGSDQLVATWKTQDRTRLDTKALKVSHPEIYKEFSKTTTTRVFLPRQLRGLEL